MKKKSTKLATFILTSFIFLYSLTIANAMRKELEFSEENKYPSFIFHSQRNPNDNSQEVKHYPKSSSDFIIKYKNDGEINECYEGAQLVFGNWMGDVNGFKLWLKIEPKVDSSNSIHVDAIWMNDLDGQKGLARKRAYIYSLTFKHMEDFSFSLHGMGKPYDECSGKLEKGTNTFTGAYNFQGNRYDVLLIRRNYIQYMEPNELEYVEVKQLFDQTSHSPSTYSESALGYRLSSVFRILNPSHSQNEEKMGKLLFHGTDKEGCDSICCTGFQNRETNRTPNLIFEKGLYLTSDVWLAASVSRQVWGQFKNGKPSDTIIVARCKFSNIGKVSHEEKQNKSWKWGEHDALHYIWPPETGHDEYVLRNCSLAKPTFLVWFE